MNVNVFSLPRPTYVHASVCDYINDMLSRDPNPSTGCLYQDVVQGEYWRTVVWGSAATYKRCSPVSVWRIWIAWLDYLCVLSTAEQGTDSRASGLCKWVWRTYSQVHWCSGWAVVALHTALTDSERFWQPGILHSISIIHVCFAAVASVTSVSELRKVQWLEEKKQG